MSQQRGLSRLRGETEKGDTMRVLVAGASGAIGSRLVPQLLDRGHEVVGTTRSPEKAEALRATGAGAVVLDVLDAEAVRRAVLAARPDAIVHQATALSGASDFKHFDRTFAQTNLLRTKGTDALLAAARAAGVERFVAQSYAGWPSVRGSGPVTTEEDPLDPQPIAAMRETHAAIRYLESAVVEAGGAVLRYGGFYPPDDAQLELVRKRKFPIVGDGGGVWSFVHLDDAAAATVLVLEQGASGIYNVVDDEPAPVREWLPALAEALGAPAPRRVPRWLARFAAGEAGVALMTEIRGASNAKAKRELGWTLRYPSWRQGFRDAYNRASAPASTSSASATSSSVVSSSG
jgi:2-alkyl-3-oxoalkanoate reductase